MLPLYSAVLSSDGLFADLIDLRGLYGAGRLRLTVDRGSVRLSAGAAPDALDVIGDYSVGVVEVSIPLTRLVKVERLTGNSSTILVEILPHTADERNVTAALSGGGVGVFAGDTAYSDAPRFNVWNPPAQPSFRDGDAGALISGLTCNAADVYALWDQLAAKYPGNLTRSLVGTDQSGTYPIYKYVFVPTGGGYETSHIFSAGIHGPESTAIFALYAFAKTLLENTPAQLAYARSRCRIVFVPLENPWGFSQAPRNRYNSRGVDINRNFDYKWADYAGAEKGTAPMSESETQAIAAVLSAHSDAVSYIPMHSLVAANNPDYYFAYSSYEAFDSVGLRAVIDALKQPGETEYWYQNFICNAYNYAGKTHGMHSFNPEYPDGKAGPMLGSADMTKALRWYGNVFIYFLSMRKKASQMSRVSPRNWFFNYRNTSGQSIIFGNSAYAELTQLTKTIDIPAPGFVHVTGHARLLHTTPTADVFMCPMVGQSNTEWVTTDQRFLDYHEDQIKIASANDRYALNFNLSIPVEATSTNVGPLKIGVWAKTSATNAQLLFYRMCVTYIPTGAEDRVTIYSALNDVASGMRKRFPNK